MKIVLQRVQESTVSVHQKVIGSIEKGLLILVGIEQGDTKKEVDWMARKVANMRIFEDADGKMNKSVIDINGAFLIIPNFTLCADAAKGNRPSFIEAAAPGKARKLYEDMIATLKTETKLPVENGDFGADMQVALINDGPVTITLEKQFEA